MPRGAVLTARNHLAQGQVMLAGTIPAHPPLRSPAPVLSETNSSTALSLINDSMRAGVPAVCARVRTYARACV